MKPSSARSGGAERRRNQMFVTLNTEYHVHGDHCVAVRDRRSGEWRAQHAALGARLLGAFARAGVGGFDPRDPREKPRHGDHLVFIRDRRDVVTSKVQLVARPPLDALRHYAATR
ncbi:MAG TPA: hypothetical protein VG389_15600 [Myxococcota bacterium]|jgi:hypothetical protein|nr:hypothetical protein [Myxococcota bacterium]